MTRDGIHGRFLRDIMLWGQLACGLLSEQHADVLYVVLVKSCIFLAGFEYLIIFLDLCVKSVCVNQPPAFVCIWAGMAEALNELEEKSSSSVGILQHFVVSDIPGLKINHDTKPKCVCGTNSPPLCQAKC